MTLGLSSYTFGWAVGVAGYPPPQPMDEHGLLDKCREHGLNLLQIGDNLPLRLFDHGRLKHLANRASDEGVRLEVGMRGLIPPRVVEYAAIARKLEASLLRVVIDDAGFHPEPSQVIQLLKEIAPELEGITLGLENHDRFHAATLREIVEAAGSEQIGICLDTANSLGAGECLETVARELAARTVNLHIKDFAIARLPHSMGFLAEGRPAGQGFLDLPWLLKQLAPWGRCKTAVLELWTPPEARLEDTLAKEAAWAAQSLLYLKTVFT